MHLHQQRCGRIIIIISTKCKCHVTFGVVCCCVATAGCDIIWEDAPKANDDVFCVTEGCCAVEGAVWAVVDPNEAPALFVDPKANVEDGVLTLLSAGTGAAGVDPNEKPTLDASFLVSVVALAVVDPNENDLGAVAAGVTLLEPVGVVLDPNEKDIAALSFLSV